MFDEIVAVFRDFWMVLIDALFDRNRPFLENSVQVNAPKEAVWNAFWTSNQIEQGSQIGYSVRQVKGSSDLFEVSWSVEGIYQSSFMRVLQMQDGEGFIAERIYDEAEPEFIQKFGISLMQTEDGKGTIISQYDFTDDLGLTDRLVTSFETRWMLRAFREFCELPEEAPKQAVVEIDEGEAFWAALSSAVAFFGCWYFYDFSWAVLILMALVFHEFGHVMAMNFLGISISSSSILPFVGGAAMTRFRFKTDLEQAFCSLMGPAISLLPSAIFFVIYLINGHVFFGAAASIFAFINLLSLLPVQPFDGGRILETLISSLKPEDILSAICTTFIVSGLYALYQGYYIAALIGILIVLTSYRPILNLLDQELQNIETDLSVDDSGTTSVRLSSVGALFIFAGLTLCVAGHTAILYFTLSDVNVASLMGY